MKLTEIAIKKPVFAWMIMASFITFGAISFTKLGISEKPDVDFPVVSVSIEWPGAAPEVIELDVIDIVESSLLSVEGIQKITSEARRGRADVVLEFNLDRDIDNAVQEVQSILGRTQRSLPDDIEPPIVRKSNPEDRPILWLSVTSSKLSKRDLMVFVRDQIKDRFQTIEGVSEVLLGGYIEPNLRVWLNDHKLKSYDLTATDIVAAIEREHAEYPAGIFENETTEYNIRVLGENTSVDDFELLSINQRGGAPNYNPIPLKSVARIEDDLDDVRRISRVMGNSSVGLGIRKQRGSNSVAVAQAVKEKMKDVANSLPEGAEIGVNYDGTVFVEDSISELQSTLIYSAIMTALVVWFFLGSLGASLNIMLSIPTALIATFMALQYWGFTLNTFTMLGLTLAVGLVVDDNIMILENISRLYKKTKNSTKAALIGTQEISFAALAASTAIIAIFVPIGFMSGIVGRYFYQFAMTITAAIIFSYIDAVTLTPMRAVFLLNRGEGEKVRWIDKVMNKLELRYSSMLNWALSHRIFVFIGAVLMIILTFFIFKNIKKEFVPPQDQSRLLLIMKTKPGSSLEFTNTKVREIEKILMSQNELQRYFVAIGGFSGNESNSAVSYVTMKPIKARPKNKVTNTVLTQQEFSDQIKKEFKSVEGIFVIVQDPSLGGFSAGRSYPVEFNLTGPNWEKLFDLSEEIKKKMSESGFLSDVDSNYKGLIPEIRIIPDRKKALARGVSVSEIGRTIQATVSGVIAGKFAKGGRRYDVRVKIEGSELTEIKDISDIMVRNNRGELVSLKDVTTIVTDEGLLSITREDRARAIAVYANLAPGKSQGEAIDFINDQIATSLPDGYGMMQSGASKTYQESFSSLLFVIALGLIIAYMILASQFNSFIHPVTILSALPFSITGAFVALWVFDKTINIYSLIGVILLMGIVKKNSIILVDFTNQLREQGMSIMDAIKEACPIRLRPILMTSVSTIAGTLPAALTFGAGSETRIPMALAVIGGVIIATFLTLFVIPCLYSVIPGKVEVTDEQAQGI